jgi:hypothetical protein
MEKSEGVILGVIAADADQPDKGPFSATRHRKCASKPLAVELLVFLIAAVLQPVLSIRGFLDDSRFQIPIDRTNMIRVNCVICWYNPPLLKLVAHRVVHK